MFVWKEWKGDDWGNRLDKMEVESDGILIAICNIANRITDSIR